MFKRTTILALAAMAGLAVSAPAASAHWFKHHNPIQADEQFQFTGQTKFSSIVVGSIECQMHGKMKLLSNQTTAQIEEYDLDTTTGKTPTELCALGGPLAPCDVTSLTSDAVQKPWVVHQTITQTHEKIHTQENRDTLEVTTGISQYSMEAVNSQPQTHNACNVVQTIQIKPGILHWTISSGSTCTIDQLTQSGQLELLSGAKVQSTGIKAIIPGSTYGTKCP